MVDGMTRGILRMSLWLLSMEDEILAVMEGDVPGASGRT